MFPKMLFLSRPLARIVGRYPGSSAIVAQESAVIAQKYQNCKVHDQGCSEHPKFKESTQSQSYDDLKKPSFFFTENWGFSRRPKI